MESNTDLITQVTTYVKELQENSKETTLVVQSRWPWMGKVVCHYPCTFRERLTLFFYTLRFSVPVREKEKMMMASIRSLQTYQKIVKVEIKLLQPLLIKGELELLPKIEAEMQRMKEQLERGDPYSEDQKELVRSWAGKLEDLSSPISFEHFASLLSKGIGEQKIELEKCISQIQARVVLIAHDRLQDQMSTITSDVDNVGNTSEEKVDKPVSNLPFPLFEYSISKTENSPEITRMYEIVTQAAVIWRELASNQAIKQEHVAEIERLRGYFTEVESTYGPYKDVLTGIGLTSLFNKLV